MKPYSQWGREEMDIGWFVVGLTWKTRVEFLRRPRVLQETGDHRPMVVTSTAVAAVLAVGAKPLQSAELGSIVAGVTVQKLMQNGAVTAEEILKIGADPDRRYRPDLAHDHRKATYHPNSEIEVVCSPPYQRSLLNVV